MEVTLEADCKETQQARKGDKVTVHYGGFLQDGESKLENLNLHEIFARTLFHISC